MSRILRRPLFRGGPVSSYGTGIASGLADNRRVGLDNGGFLYSSATGRTPTGAQLMQNANTGLKGWLNRNVLGSKTQLKMNDDSVSENLSGDVEIKDYLDEGGENDWMTQYDSWEEVPTWKKNVPFTKDIWENKQEIKEQAESAKGFLPNSGPAPMKGVTEINNTPVVVDPKTGNPDDPYAAANQTESTTISADDIREQAALFDKLLNEDYEKDKRSAQIGDASDYALQFFQSTVGEGKGIKEAAGDVAGYALHKPSRTEKVQEGKKKTKQTATVMAINEALASNKSDRELDKMFAKMGLDEAMRTRLLNKRMTLELEVAKGTSITKRVAADKSGDSDVKKLRKHTKAWAEDQEVPLGSIRSIVTEKKQGSNLDLVTDLQLLLVPENKNAVFIDETSKKAYQVVEDENGDLKLKQIG